MYRRSAKYVMTTCIRVSTPSTTALGAILNMISLFGRAPNQAEYVFEWKVLDESISMKQVPWLRDQGRRDSSTRPSSRLSDGRRSAYSGPGSIPKSQTGDIGFELGADDHSQTLIIDPVLTFSTYIGADLDDEGTGVALIPRATYTYSETYSATVPRQAVSVRTETLFSTS